MIPASCKSPDFKFTIHELWKPMINRLNDDFPVPQHAINLISTVLKYTESPFLTSRIQNDLIPAILKVKIDTHSKHTLLSSIKLIIEISKYNCENIDVIIWKFCELIKVNQFKDIILKMLRDVAEYEGDLIWFVCKCILDGKDLVWREDRNERLNVSKPLKTQIGENVLIELESMLVSLE